MIGVSTSTALDYANSWITNDLREIVLDLRFVRFSDALNPTQFPKGIVNGEMMRMPEGKI